MSGRRYPSSQQAVAPELRNRQPPSSVDRRVRRVVLPAKKPAVKPGPQDAARLVETATVAAASALAGGHYGSYDNLRADVMRGFAVAFTTAYGMPVGDGEPRLGMLWSHQLSAFEAAVASLDYVSLEPDHFGHVHETLSAWTLAEGRLVPSSERRGGGVHFTPRSLTAPIVATTLQPLLALSPPERTLELRVCDPAVGGGAFLLEVVRQLGQRLVDAGIEEDILAAKRLVAVHCAYGVDTSRWAVAAAKIALWLECRACSMPVGWLDDNIKTGDALVGLLDAQFDAFHWSPTGTADLDAIALRALRTEAVSAGAEQRRERMRALATAAKGET